MAKNATLRVRAVKGTLVPVIGARITVQYVGRAWNGEPAPAGVRGIDLLEHQHPPCGDVEIPNIAEYVAAVRAGDLEAADKATADACGVKFTGAAHKPIAKATEK